MKKFSKVLLSMAAAIAVILVPALAFAQDSTSVAATTSGVVETVISALEIKWPVIATVGTILFFLSEGLSLIPTVKANGVFQLVSSILAKLFKKP